MRSQRGNKFDAGFLPIRVVIGLCENLSQIKHAYPSVDTSDMGSL
jgi:hypothetical protein